MVRHNGRKKMAYEQGYSNPTSLATVGSSLIPTPWAEHAQPVDESAVQQLLGARGVSPEELSGTGFTYRHDWGNLHGGWKLTLNWGSDIRIYVDYLVINP